MMKFKAKHDEKDEDKADDEMLPDTSEPAPGPRASLEPQSSEPVPGPMAAEDVTIPVHRSGKRPTG